MNKYRSLLFVHEKLILIKKEKIVFLKADYKIN